MPILIKDFTWTQSESRICINLPLKGTNPNKIDFLNSLEFCKVSYPPFLFECWFYAQIKDENYTTIVKDGIISLQFSKCEDVIWPQLFHLDFDNKELLKKVREDAIVYSGERATRIAKEKLETIENNKKQALKEQMKIEEDERKEIETIKETERKKVTTEIENFKAIQKNLMSEKPPKQELISADEVSEKKSIFDQPTSKVQNETINEPAPRSTGSIQIKFTPRVFPTPMRESQDKMEKEWLEKQAEARKLVELPEEFTDLTADEKNLDWLKEKASNYYKQENYQAAISVYNHAIRLFPKMASFYSNRAACHFNIRNLIKCVEDCSKALELLTPPVADNAKSRLRAHVRRGTAFCHLELYPEGLLDYEAALKIEPDNEEIKSDAENIRKIILGTQPSNEKDASLSTVEL